MELMAAKKSRVTDFKKQQAQIKIMEIEMIKQKYNEVIASGTGIWKLIKMKFDKSVNQKLKEDDGGW